MMKRIPEKPADVTWTDEQWRAIHAGGQNVLVAAAAGSGKTAVLVNRIITRLLDEDDPCNVDELLVVTFTNASAAEMKHRIGRALESELEKAPDSLYLKRQVALLNTASISTLHSFCLDLIRKYYYRTDVDPDFRLMDTIESMMLRDEVLDQFLEEEFSKEENTAFFHLADAMTDDRTDQNLADLISKLYDFAQSSPEPKKWLAGMVHFYDEAEVKRINELSYYPIILESLQQEIEKAHELLSFGKRLSELPDGPGAYVDTFADDLRQVEMLADVLGEEDFDQLRTAFQSIAFKRIATLKNKDELDANLVEQAKKARDVAKKVIQEANRDWFKREASQYLDDLRSMKPDVRTLADLVERFSERFFAAKSERGVLDFSDLEHLALAVLREADGSKSVVAEELTRRYKEVLIDEYQDTNLVQEMILSLVTQPDEASGDLFMVGDVKQSIYRFRLAEPALFMGKYRRYSKSGENTGLRIDLSKNFRSRAEVLDAVNFIFKQIMDRNVGEIDYDEDAELYLGAEFPAGKELETELLIVDRDQDQVREAEDGELTPNELKKDQLEARAVAKRIADLVEQRFQIYDKETRQFRQVEYRDIVILSRSMTSATDMEEAMRERDIPFYASSQTGYFEAIEVAVMISLLKIVDNPYQDIPLASVLRSPIVGLSEEELAQIRLQKKQGYFFDGLRDYVSENHNGLSERLADFLAQLKKWRDLAIREDLTSLIWQIYEDTDFYEFVGGLSGGKTRQANLRALYERAGQYEKTAFRGLFRFVRFVERLELRGEDLGTAKTLGEKEDVVRMMTIHSSKGLEFPVVILAGINRKFNRRDITSKTLLDQEFGFASSYTNTEKRITYPTIMQQAVKQKKTREMLAEEMRVLYVALTRAEEKLILVGTVPKWENSLAQFLSAAETEETLLPASERLSATTYLDWIGRAFVRHPNFLEQAEADDSAVIVKPLATKMKLKLMVMQQAEFEPLAAKRQSDNFMKEVKEFIKVPLAEDTSEIAEVLGFSYPNLAETKVYSKQSVTELKRQFQIQDSFTDDRFVQTLKGASLDRPKFLQTEKELTAAEIGTAMHTVMQAVPLESKPDLANLEALLDEMVAKEKLTEAEKNGIRREQILGFFETKIGEALLDNASQAEREVPFVYQVPVSEVNRDAHTDSPILVQGVVDLLLVYPEHVILVDYKTDKVQGKYSDKETAMRVMKGRYEVQIKLYRQAVEAIIGKPVTAAYLYFFDSRDLLEL
ncbi:ATP-dependent nuclease subunit A [Listeria floridensis FSL S10-1187]|uniref:ATP-dependent helicase/nuclease subunit A n=1 Tax=Listeria floridensis FSL S10-1187 TaxID=1265817 RepID=A0ABP3B132_9LIST|nr:helicase-exonuclease AddAB subunit AddA [Listeria floridensis]EUJ33639.1 ATP-dependent nuclease subunit A [Listeria floridensis FSL S10-1187]